MNKTETDAVLSWGLDFTISSLSFVEQIKLLGRMHKYAQIFSRPNMDKNFAGYIALKAMYEMLSKQILLDFEHRAKLGRLQTGAQSDHGQIVHAVNKFGAICGSKPGKKSVGWSDGDYDTLTCPDCLKRIEQIRSLPDDPQY